MQKKYEICLRPVSYTHLGYRQNGLPVPELEAALKNVHDEVRQVRHFERMQEVDLFSGEKPGRKNCLLYTSRCV